MWRSILGLCSQTVFCRVGDSLLRFLSLFFSSPSLPHSLGFAQDSPWLSWSNSVEVAFWFAVAQANAGGCFFFGPCSFVLLFLYFFLAKVTAVFLLFFGPGFIVEV
jgi:hypothetical protein